MLASSMSARAPWRRSRCSWRRRLAAPPPWLPFSSSMASSSSPFSSSDWRNSIGSCCSWSSALALPCCFTFVVVGARCSRVCQYLQEQRRVVYIRKILTKCTTQVLRQNCDSGCKTGNFSSSVESFVFTYFASHSATALLSTDWAFPRPSFGSSLFRREKGCLGQ